VLLHLNEYVNTRAEMYDGNVHWPHRVLLQVSHVEYAATGQTDRRTDGRQIVTLRFPLDAASVIILASLKRSCLAQPVRVIIME